VLGDKTGATTAAFDGITGSEEGPSWAPGAAEIDKTTLLYYIPAGAGERHRLHVSQRVEGTDRVNARGVRCGRNGHWRPDRYAGSATPMVRAVAGRCRGTGAVRADTVIKRRLSSRLGAPPGAPSLIHRIRAIIKWLVRWSSRTLPGP